MILFKFSERTGASTGPPPSVPMPKLLIPKNTFKAVLLYYYEALGIQGH